MSEPDGRGERTGFEREEPVQPEGGGGWVAAVGPRLEAVQKWMLPTSVVFFLLGFLASIDVMLLPRGTPSLAWGLHPLLFLLGAAGGLAGAMRGRQIDAKRWQLVQDDMLTDGERELAHHEAERERRWAGTVFLLGPLFFGYWMAYQVAPPEGGSMLTFLLTVSPMVGFVVGLVAGGKVLGPEERPY